MINFPNVSVDAVANIYFDGRVVSHSVKFPDGTKKTLGIIFPGTYKFASEAPELMEITDGSCEVSVDDSGTTRFVPTDESFEVPANSGFSITVNSGVCQYICSYLTP
ncbi:MAG: pyrimidine/purine nucleoside phosphorylase [Akkermansiaceae bacterium]|nr:pyrimidine/purine nucleoside phosphorylase [Akkermansiaceae bacterium]